MEISAAVSVFTVKALPVALLLSLSANETQVLLFCLKVKLQPRSRDAVIRNYPECVEPLLIQDSESYLLVFFFFFEKVARSLCFSLWWVFCTKHLPCDAGFPVFLYIRKLLLALCT